MGFIIRFSYLYMTFTYYPLLFLLLPFLCLMSLLFPASPPPHPTPPLHCFIVCCHPPHHSVGDPVGFFRVIYKT